MFIFGVPGTLEVGHLGSELQASHTMRLIQLLYPSTASRIILTSNDLRKAETIVDLWMIFHRTLSQVLDIGVERYIILGLSH